MVPDGYVKEGMWACSSFNLGHKWSQYNKIGPWCQYHHGTVVELSMYKERKLPELHFAKGG